MSELERYGVAALAVTLILVLLISLGGLTSSGDGELAKIPLPDATATSSIAVAADEPLVVERTDAGLSEPTSSLAYAEDVRIEAEPAPPAKPGQAPPAVRATMLTSAEPTARPTRSSSARTATVGYRVQRGDTLARLAEKHLGTAKRWNEIRDLNAGLDTMRLFVGQEIRLPASQTGAGTTKKLARSQSAVKIYTVEKGDTLESIAEQQLGDKRRWREIHDFNRKRLRNPDHLREGIKLQMPER